MSERANYFKIGLFILIAIAIALAGLMALGAGTLFQPKFYAETYFEESVQGLDIGSPIKFRGVPIGKVEEITLVSAEYDTEKRYVLVRVSLFSKAFGAVTQSGVDKLVKKEVEKGLRVQLAFPGVTGTAYLEADYMPPERAPWLSIDWKPKDAYIPSAPSTITRYTEAIDRILKSIEQIDIQALIGSIDKALSSLSKATEEARVDQISDQAVSLLKELRVTNSRLERLVARSEGPLGRFLDELPETASSLHHLSIQLNKMATELPAQAQPLGKAIRRLNGLLVSEQQNIEDILNNTRQASENLRDLTENARQYPSQIILGAPPPATEP
jgi:phospholipid/cholesterol/gamma-HCH transport system substrate-binding protein